MSIAAIDDHARSSHHGIYADEDAVCVAAGTQASDHNSLSDYPGVVYVRGTGE